ncbi:FkbM family methyltransferase [Pokkaliibacter sp. MBI-7]|uniref:FkbM family methyltransferase n=1 Tax=Pokkaliibacter sp. MBI-7 TaxID=3040600 RepID=UPI002447A6CF|nr:FkbM family methyltransferase [Pokkaliibacter sp. MBI-7]MDH2434200.1 FkbM family methyltransferase [Pokkaliibacter sp. MBI-7]
MTFISHAQNLEDVLLWRCFQEVENGFYIDLGAAQPDTHSVTKLFYDNGWCGVNVDANDDFIKELKQDRPRDINLFIGVGEDSSRGKFYKVKNTGLSTFDEHLAASYVNNGYEVENYDLNITSLKDICAEHVGNRTIHFLKIDVEGFERKVIAGGNWKLYRPWVVIVEATIPTTTVENYSSWETDLINYGYLLAYKDGLNRFYVATERKGLLKHFEYPPNVFDGYVLSECHYLNKENERLNAEVNSYRIQSAMVLDLKNQIESIEHSLSWRLTQPLREYNPVRLIPVVLSALKRHPRLLSVVKSAVQKSPWLWDFLKRRFLFNNSLYGKESFVDIGYESFRLRFARGPLEDMRGIGRVSRELLSKLEARRLVQESEAPTAAVHFYSSVHWCPNILPSSSVVMIHDVIPMILPELFPRVCEEWRGRYKRIAQQADLVVTISDTSARDINKYLDIPLEKIRIIYNGVTLLPVDPLRDDIKINKKYLVYIGSCDHHKNLEVVLKALRDQRLADISLAIIGDSKKTNILVEKLGVSSKVILLGRLDDGQVGAVVSKAIALVFPSLYEGFGLPPMEAAQLHVPSICSRKPAMTELLEGAAMFADPDLPDEWVENIVQLSSDQEYRQQLATLAYQRVQEFSWDECAQKLLKEVSEMVLQKQGKFES